MFIARSFTIERVSDGYPFGAISKQSQLDCFFNLEVFSVRCGWSSTQIVNLMGEIEEGV